MLGAIVGDIVGSKYEFNNLKSKEFVLFDEDNHFTDDTVMTLAVYKSLKRCKGDYRNLPIVTIKTMQELANHFPEVGYGEKFQEWLNAIEPKPYNSWGNGAAMRVSPVAYFANSLEEVKYLSRKVTAISHNHPQAIKGAEAVASAIFLARQGKSKEELKTFVEEYYYPLDFDYEDLKSNYKFHVSCKNTVPQAFFCFFESENFEDAIRTAISIGGDSDTIAAIVGSLAEAYYGIPKEIETTAKQYLDLELLTTYENCDRLLEVEDSLFQDSKSKRHFEQQEKSL
ncbi:MAG: ADP-ribosylglycohydrolase family protein [Clostridia bacterium]|nr:ADP-ribosylglycohydrolase family protein [Clostridia bacterium]